MGQCKSENNTNGDRLDHRRKGLMKVKAMNLMKTLGYQPCFELVDGTINIFLYSENSILTVRR